ncbi:fibronectin type III domain-containing protein [Tenacibaculum amylolyticum]|uniref:hypothetical protein n=1 Tax=Tenacibaculum amylolyticum TaxID=104269 RepID=UPI00389512B2
MKYLSLLLALALFIFSGCSSDNGTENTQPNTTIPINLDASLIQKGPFLQGSTISIQELNDDLSLTGKTYSTETIDDFGSFNFNAEIESNKIDISATGFYFNEVSGELSDAPLTLRTYVEFSDEKVININILSTLGRKRIKYLILNEEKTFSDAKIQAEKEILTAFNVTESIQENINIDFNEMDISKSGENNAILLAISAIVQGNNSVAELGEFISKIADDLETDGIINNNQLTEEITNNSMSLDLTIVRQNLINRFEELNVTYTIPEFEQFVDSDGDGILNTHDTSLIYPKNEVNNTKPEFSWSASNVTGTKYHFQLASNNDFTTILIDEENLTETTLLSTIILENNKEYFWRVNALDENGNETAWNTTQFSVLLNKIVLVSPNTTINNSQPEFSWEASNLSEVTYTIQLASDSNFSNLLFEESDLNTLSYTSELVLPQNNTSYFWRVKIIDANGVSSDWSSEEFLLNIGSIELTSPINDIVGSPTFNWSTTSNLSNILYDIQVANNANFTNLIFEETGLTTTSVASNLTLENNTTYHWRVRFKDQNELYTDWTTATFNFVIRSPQFLPTTYSNTEINKFLLEYDINAYPNYENAGIKMQIQVSTNSNFSTIEKDLNSLDLQSNYDIWDAAVDGYGIFYIRARHVTPDGNTSEWRSLGLISIYEAELIVTEKITTSTRPIIKWSHSGGVDGFIPSSYKYLIEVFEDSNLTTLIESNTQPIAIDTATEFPEYQVSTDLDNNKDYFFRLSMIDDNDTVITSISDTIVF